MHFAAPEMRPASLRWPEQSPLAQDEGARRHQGLTVALLVAHSWWGPRQGPAATEDESEHQQHEQGQDKKQNASDCAKNVAPPTSATHRSAQNSLAAPPFRLPTPHPSPIHSTPKFQPP